LPNPPELQLEEIEQQQFAMETPAPGGMASPISSMSIAGLGTPSRMDEGQERRRIAAQTPSVFRPGSPGIIMSQH